MMKSTLTDELESELSIHPIDHRRLEELQQHEAVKLLVLIKEDDYIQSNMKEGTRHSKWGVLLKT